MALKTDAAVKAWLASNMPATFAKEFGAEEQDVLCHTLVHSELYEEYLHLRFKAGAIVISLGRPGSDEAIFKHYAERGVREYRKYTSKASFPGFELPLRVTRVAFTTSTDPAASVPMPSGLQAKLIPAAEKSDDVAFEFEKLPEGRVLMCFAWKNVHKRYFLYRLACACRRHDLALGDIRFAFLNSLTANCVLVGTIELEGKNVADPIEMKRFIREFELLRTFRGFDGFLDLVENKMISGNQANLLRAMTALLEQTLVEVNPSMYTAESIAEAFCFHPELTVDFIKLFKARFHPKVQNKETYATLKKAFLEKLVKLDTGRKKHDDRRRLVFKTAVLLSDHITRTNAYSYRKLGIGFRIDPAYLDLIEGFDRKAKFPEVPYGVFFVHGGNYMGIQVRFRDLSRGGMRTVIAWDQEHERYERPNVFTECYNLAFTQQKKNKDIPEGGAKSVVFLSANTELQSQLEMARREMAVAGMAKEKIEEAIPKLQKDLTFEYMFSNQRCFLMTLLTLIVWDFEKNRLKFGENIVDHMGIPEYIYLGPDENFHDALIHWLSHKSTELGNFSRGAFISGKEETGVNHKEYGVTSWGCLQFLHQAIKFAGITGEFTVKLTGGPDGDVAGNTIRLLRKYYPTRAKLIMITDASGTACDPAGFSLEVLEGMFHKVQTISEYPREKLSEGAWILCIKQTRQATSLSKEVLCIRKQSGKIVEEWTPSSTAFHTFGTNAHVTKADVFLPSGGRPRALNMNNIQDFFDEAGNPTARIIVEGANLYITQDAREHLESKGVLLFRDSSANKCGVISSSYEIIGGLTLEDAQFVKVKPELAKDILERLEKAANAEALCMIDYYVKNDRKIRMTAISELVSQKINRFTDDMAAYLAPVDLQAPENKALLDIFINYLPACIRRDYLAQAMVRIPDMHKKAIISTRIACDLVYGKGLSWWPTVPDILPTILKK